MHCMCWLKVEPNKNIFHLEWWYFSHVLIQIWDFSFQLLLSICVVWKTAFYSSDYLQAFKKKLLTSKKLLALWGQMSCWKRNALQLFSPSWNKLAKTNDSENYFQHDSWDRKQNIVIRNLRKLISFHTRLHHRKNPLEA